MRSRDICRNTYEIYKIYYNYDLLYCNRSMINNIPLFNYFYTAILPI